MIGERNKMGKADQISENVPGISPQTEASKLLEQALMQMDGIISGSGSLTAHNPDYGFATGPPSVREAANNLATALQNATSPPAPDPNVAKVLLHWIQQTLVNVSKMDNYCHYQDPPQSSSEDDEVTFLLRLKPTPTPPARRKRKPNANSVTTPKGWDVVIERRDRDVSSPNSSSVCSSPLRQRKFSFGNKEGNAGFGHEDDKTKDNPPPVPPRFKPSAPPQESEQNFYWWAPSGGFLFNDEYCRQSGGFPNYYNMISNGVGFGGSNCSSVQNIQCDPVSHTSQEQQRHSIIRTAAAPSQSTPTYSISRPLSATGFPSSVNFLSQNVSTTEDSLDFGNICASMSPVVGRSPKPSPKSLVTAQKSIHEAVHRNEEAAARESCRVRVSATPVSDTDFLIHKPCQQPICSSRRIMRQ